jgi:kinesin family member 2/24
MHSNLDMALFCQNVTSEPFESSPFMAKEMDEEEEDVIAESQHGLSNNNSGAFISEKENTVVSARESNVAKIKVVVCSSF